MIRCLRGCGRPPMSTDTWLPHLICRLASSVHVFTERDLFGTLSERGLLQLPMCVGRGPCHLTCSPLSWQHNNGQECSPENCAMQIHATSDAVKLFFPPPPPLFSSLPSPPFHSELLYGGYWSEGGPLLTSFTGSFHMALSVLLDITPHK